ncbi:MAG: beta-ketoacyl-ACP synthase 3 [Candidatus Diapherotrites archaeon]
MKAEIRAIGTYAPERVLLNEELIGIKGINTSDEFIREKFGVRERRVAENENTSDLGVKSVEIALKKANMKKEDLDAIVVATMTPDLQCPSTACIIQEKLGLKGIPAFDLSAFCSGYVYGLDTVARMLDNRMKGDSYKNIAFVTAEKMSGILDYSDRTVSPIFGDIGCTTIVSKSEKDKVISSYLYADGSGKDALIIPEGGRYLKMEGKDVYDFATELFPKLVKETLRKAEMHLDDVDWIFPHQANVNIIKKGLEALGLGMEKTFLNMDKYGNTAAASIPLAIGEGIEKGKVKRGDILLCVGFGAGWTGGGIVLEF